ncbi:flagellar hook-length control protein FliK [Bacillus luteolus]|uniref:Flagellar hook-length control protein FliK n=1 Tax=Litchfieldia luteola TaxID=682179 RepID=A0ABR9QJQ3_9BACI|nr:flagellar hook-length control protein FliK [Cytobacillus luteolus]MBE4908726.1 flagellar hook-length control protein FliK [Cytobacillus luteolus]MBP1941585.1 flagellar hook-length control protein FliK [Cytobacillus luteolus]
MRIETFSLTNQNDTKFDQNDQSQKAFNFSGLLSLISTTHHNPTESIRNKLGQNLVMNQQFSNIGESEDLMELESESFSAFVELLTKSEKGFFDSGNNVDIEINEAIAVLVNQSEGTEKNDLESLITELLASLPNDVKSNIEQILQSFMLGGSLDNSLDEQLNPENTIALLILLARSVQDGKKLMENPSVSKIVEHVNRQLKTINLSQIIPSKQDLSKTLNKLVELSNTIVEKITQNHGKITEVDSNRSYLQSVFSRYFAQPNGLKVNHGLVAQAVVTDQEGIQTSFKSDMNTQGIIGTPDLQVPMTKVQQFALFVEQHGKQTINQEQFIKEFQNILARSQIGNGKDGMKLLIKLYPEHLGSLRIELLQKDNMMIARIIASSGAAKDVLESQIQSLKQSFLSQNIQVEKIEVSQQFQQPDRFLQKESQQHNGHGNRQMNDNNQQEESELNQSFESALQEELNVKV